MSHPIDFDGLEEKLFILRHLVHGAASFSVAERIEGEDEAPDQFNWYWGWLKGLLSNYLIECAVKARMIQEFCGQEDEEGDLVCYEREAVGQSQLGLVVQGDFKLTLREVANKIIHSTRAVICFQDVETDGGIWKAWDGKYHLYGSYRSDSWHLELFVDSWAKAMSEYLRLLSENEKTVYMGQDWS